MVSLGDFSMKVDCSLGSICLLPLPLKKNFTKNKLLNRCLVPLKTDINKTVFGFQYNELKIAERLYSHLGKITVK